MGEIHKCGHWKWKLLNSKYFSILRFPYVLQVDSYFWESGWNPQVRPLIWISFLSCGALYYAIQDYSHFKVVYTWRKTSSVTIQWSLELPSRTSPFCLSFCSTSLFLFLSVWVESSSGRESDNNGAVLSYFFSWGIILKGLVIFLSSERLSDSNQENRYSLSINHAEISTWGRGGGVTKHPLPPSPPPHQYLLSLFIQYPDVRWMSFFGMRHKATPPQFS